MQNKVKVILFSQASTTFIIITFIIGYGGIKTKFEKKKQSFTFFINR